MEITELERSSIKKTREFKGESLLECPADYTVIDIETTGLDPSIDEIIEVAALRIRDNEIVDSFSSFVKPSNPVSDFISSLTGITNEMLKTAPLPLDVLEKYLDFIADDILIGHNTHFDINFLYDASMSYVKKPVTNDFVDTLRLAKRRIHDTPNYRLQTLTKYFHISCENHHRALADCEATNLLYASLCNMPDVDGVTTDDVFHFLEDSGRLANAQAYFCNKKVCIKGSYRRIARDVAIDVINRLGGDASINFWKDCDILCLSSRVHKKYTRYSEYDRSAVVEKAKELHDNGTLNVLSEDDLMKILAIPSTYNNHDPLSQIQKHEGLENPDSPLFKKTCVFTGTLDRMPRKDAMQIVVDIGGICANSITKKTNFLILGTQDYRRTGGDKSSKQKKAEQYILSGVDLQIISENVFYDMLQDYSAD